MEEYIMSTQKILFFAAVIFCFGILFQSNDCVAQIPPFETDPDALSLTASENHITLSLTTYSNVEWCVERIANNWVHSKTQFGKGSGKIDLAIDNNPGGEREGYVTIGTENPWVRACVIIRQKGEKNSNPILTRNLDAGSLAFETGHSIMTAQPGNAASSESPRKYRSGNENKPESANRR
jgi:hypothetical protein